MNCTCIQDSETEIAKRYTADLGVAATAKACNVAFGLSMLGGRHYLPFAVKADATGYRSAKGKEVPCSFPTARSAASTVTSRRRRRHDIA